MKTVLILLTALAFLMGARYGWAQTAPATPTHMQLFLLIGQSNMAGRGTVDPNEQPDPHIFALGKNKTWEPAKDPLHFDKPKMVGVGPGLSFARTVLKSDPSVTIGLIPAAMGGSSLDEWAPGGKLYKNAVDRARIAMHDGTLVGILWHQGEADSAADKVATYGTRFTAMIASLRKDLGAEKVPVIMGELGRFRPQDASVAFNAALPAVAAGVPLCGFVTTEGLTDRGDHLHFDTASAHTLGERYAAEYLKLKAAAK